MLTGGQRILRIEVFDVLGTRRLDDPQLETAAGALQHFAARILTALFEPPEHDDPLPPAAGSAHIRWPWRRHSASSASTSACWNATPARYFIKPAAGTTTHHTISPRQRTSLS